jgi:hypothetical protein
MVHQRHDAQSAAHVFLRYLINQVGACRYALSMHPHASAALRLTRAMKLEPVQ